MTTNTLTQKKLNNLGSRGEKQAVSFLLKENYQILETNYRFKRLEIDIIALDKNNNDLVFIEVKTRSNSFFGNPSLAVNRKKLYNLQKVAQHFLLKEKLDNLFRFDIIAISASQVEHFKNITAEFS